MNKDLKAEKIEKIYNQKMAKRYEFSMPHSFDTWKRKAIQGSSLKSGDTVLVFCCGTGADFPPILKKIGKTGKIIGVDFSKDMLDQAQSKIIKKGWGNIELVNADVTTFKLEKDEQVDAGVCTLGLSIIPDFLLAYHNLLNHIEAGGEVIVGDMQLASGWLGKLNPITIAMAKRYGGTHEGHNNSLIIQDHMNRELTQIRKKQFFMNAYFYCIGKKPI